MSILEKAYAAAGLGGTSKTTSDVATKKGAPSYAMLQSGFGSYALAVLTGRRSVDMGHSNWKAQEGMTNFLPFSWELQEAYELSKSTGDYSSLPVWEIFKQDKDMVDRWMAWFEDNSLDLDDVYDSLRIGSYQKVVRREELNSFFITHSLDEDLRAALQPYIEATFPGKRGTGQYEATQQLAFRNLKAMLKRAGWL